VHWHWHGPHHFVDLGAIAEWFESLFWPRPDEREVVVPDFTGMDAEEARSAARKARVRVRMRSVDSNPPMNTRPIVRAQETDPGTEVDQRTVVHLIVVHEQESASNET
jgi:hypothetical protein